MATKKEKNIIKVIKNIIKITSRFIVEKVIEDLLVLITPLYLKLKKLKGREQEETKNESNSLKKNIDNINLENYIESSAIKKENYKGVSIEEIDKTIDILNKKLKDASNRKENKIEDIINNKNTINNKNKNPKIKSIGITLFDSLNKNKGYAIKVYTNSPIPELENKYFFINEVPITFEFLDKIHNFPKRNNNFSKVTTTKQNK